MNKSPDSNDTRSPARKKSKSLAQSRKTYFFKPQNTLAFSPNASSSIDATFRAPAKQPNADESGNQKPEAPAHTVLVLDLRLPSLQEHGMRPEIANRTLLARNNDKPNEQQSSDDSFDGVRWRSDQKLSKFSRPILSSPLKRSEIRDTSEKPVESITNEITDSMLTKYGVGLENSLSQTPHFLRAYSDMPALSSDASPSLSRSKSFDPNSLTARNDQLQDGHGTYEYGLHRWIDQFDDTPYKNSSNEVRIEERPPVTLLESNLLHSSPKETASLQHEKTIEPDDDNLSSDDDLFLANLRVDSLTQSATSSVHPNNATNSLDHATNLLVSDEDADPFSDELDILFLNTLATQPSTNTTGQKSTNDRKSEPDATCENEMYVEIDDGPKLSYERPDFARYQLKSILRSSYQHQGHKRNQLILSVVDSFGLDAKLVVRGEASELNLMVNDIIHVIHTYPDNQKLIDDAHNLLIWNPDILISSTVVADQIFCPRKTVLLKRYSFPGALSLPLILGTIVHEIFQICMITEKFTLDFMENLLSEEVQKNLFEIFSIGDIVEELKSEARKQFKFLRDWFLQYYKTRPREIPTNKRQQKVKFSVAEILDIEESVWSPMFGLKGIADVTIKANIGGDTGTGQFLLPMEIKTGRPHLSHQAQAALYSLLFKDRYNVEISSFLLVYSLDEGSTTKHTISTPDLRSLVNLRNRISSFLKPGDQSLPDLIRRQECQRCVVRDSCMTINYMIEDGLPSESGLEEDQYVELVEHLNIHPEYGQFFKFWDNLISKEEQFQSRVNKELWVMTAKEREKLRGKALGDLIISKCLDEDVNSNSYVYVFRRNKDGTNESMLNTQIGKHDRIIVSDQEGHFALAQGVVTFIDARSITILTRRQIVGTHKKSDIFHRAQVLHKSQSPISQGNEVVFRIDKDEFYYGMGLARFNILNLFLAQGDLKRRDLIVNLRPPTFTSSPQFLIDGDEECFNDDQLLAFKRVSCTKDYCLILGMPGTGKTTVIAHLIKMLVNSKKTVLLTSYTNSAVDNILLKLLQLGVDFIRTGHFTRVHPEIRPYCVSSDQKQINTFRDFEREITEPYVVATTCLGMKDLIFSVRTLFDYCIVDEASQVSMPVSIGPISRCDKFVLVGDHFQLPPLVTHPDPDVRHGLSKSLFQYLAVEHPESVVELHHQYRMSKEIMEISNVLVYDNRLQCGSLEVANQKLVLPRPSGFLSTSPGQNDISWIQHALNEDTHVAFFNHDPIAAFEKSVGENIVNPTEVNLTVQLVNAFCASGVDPADIGVMTLYKAQLKLLLDAFEHIPELEVLTADRFQGRDKKCIIISMVRANPECRSGALLKDWRRINVAVTRARSKLIIFGSEKTMSTAESARKFTDLSSRKGWTFNLTQYPEAIGDTQQFRSTKIQSGKLAPAALQRHPILKNILDDMI